MGNESAKELIKKYLEGTATPEEDALLESWYIAMADELQEPKITSPIPLWPCLAAAASVLVILAIGFLFALHKRPAQGLAASQPVKDDILPARTTATLILHVGSLPFYTLTTGPGEHYSMILPDGTKVWLNAASSITYPVAFDGNQRNVKVTGELYFEIVHNPKQPFRVSVKDQLVEDLGTHLNINAYDDAPAINTTLLEGSVKVTKGTTSVILTPGQQASMGPHDSSFQIKQVGTEEAVAWKNGYFYFDRADIRTVMRELARWYNIQVVYKGNISKRTFKGKVYRNINASEALSILSYFGAHVLIRGKTITISS